MKASVKVLAAGALGALAVAAPAAAAGSSVAALAAHRSAAAAPRVNTPISAVKASGTVRVLDMHGTITGFRLSYGVTKKPFLTYSDGDGKVLLRSVTLKLSASTANAVRFTGIGVVNGKRVPFHAIVVQRGLTSGGQDRFGVSWGHGALFGGHLMSGAVHIYLPVSHVGYRPATKT